MEFKILNEDKNSITSEVENADDTVLNPLISELLKVSDVAEARYHIGHPELEKPILVVKTKKGKPQTVLKKAAENLAEQYGEARKLLEKELK